MTVTEPPCKNCAERHIGCHNDRVCPAWQEWQTEETKRKEVIQKTLQADKIFRAVQAEKDVRITRRMRGRRAR